MDCSQRLHGTCHGRMLFTAVSRYLQSAHDGVAIDLAWVPLDLVQEHVASILVPHVDGAECVSFKGPLAAYQA